MKTGDLMTAREIARRLDIPIATLTRAFQKLGIKPDFQSSAVANLFRPSRLSQIRGKLEASKDPREKAALARAARELKGTAFEFADTLPPDLESVRKRIEQTKDPREKVILARHARGPRTNQRKKQK